MRLMVGMAAVLALVGSASAGWAQDGHEAAEGARIFKRVCFMCHTSEAGRNKIGPSLFGVVGRKSGTAPGFSYSEAMKGADITWNAGTLDKYLTDPRKVVPGNKMAYFGLKKAEERKEVIAYLQTLH